MKRVLPVVVLLAGTVLSGQTLTCPAGGTFAVVAGQVVFTCTATVTRPTFSTPLTAKPTSVVSGTPVVFTWQLGGGAPTSQTLDPGAIPIPPDARTWTLTPTVTRTYTLTARNTAGSSQSSATVTVTAPPVTTPPAISAFGCSATQIAPGGSATCNWTVTGSPAPTLTLTPVGTVTGTSRVVSPTVTTVYQLHAVNSAGKASSGMWTITVSSGPPPTEPIWGPVDPDVLGDFTATEHDAFTVPGGDGFRYRTFHYQCPVIQNGQLRCYAHDHGDDPETAGDAWVKANWDQRFGYAARRHKTPAEPDGHVEAHEGYKVFVANKGDTNDEGRINRTWTLAYVHMGTFRTPRFVQEHHSGSLASRHDWPGDPEMRVAFHLLMDTGGTDVVCAPRHDAPIKDVMALGSRCLLDSPYEIWGMTQTIREQGASQEVARLFQVPASFKPVSVLNPANPAEPVMAWDPRVASIKKFPNQDWSGHKDDVRETYAQNPYLYTAGRTTDEYWTDPMGLVVPSTAPNAIKQYVQRGINRIGLASTQDNLQFKMKVDYGRGCEPDRDGNCTAPRRGITGKASYAKLGIKN